MTVKLRLLSITDGYWRFLTVIVEAVVKALSLHHQQKLGERRVAARTRTRVHVAEFKISQRTSGQVLTRQRDIRSV